MKNRGGIIMEWQDVLNDKSLRNLPYKVELNKCGKIVMSPASNVHSIYQAMIGDLIKKYKNNGMVFYECSVETVDGVKVADTVWASDEFMKEYKYKALYDIAPEICVEVVSPSNSEQEIKEKISLYLSKGAKEVWVCYENGNIEFYTIKGKIETSNIVSEFPNKIEL
jgi:Uma2 family endonuclease